MKYIFLALTVLMVSPTYAAGPVGESYLLPQFRPGETSASVFSISRSVRADGFDELVRRNGGSADYLAIESSAGSWGFRAIYRSDGQPAQEEVGYFREGGRSYCANSACNRYLDASGLLYNPALWGDAAVGESSQVGRP